VPDLAGRPPLGLKHDKPVRGTSAAKAHMARVKGLPCVICGHPPPSDAHHVISGRYGSCKASDLDTISLCKNHHQGQDGIHTAKAAWEDAHGPDWSYLPVVARMLE